MLLIRDLAINRCSGDFAEMPDDLAILNIIKRKKRPIASFFFYTQDAWYFARGRTLVAKIEQGEAGQDDSI